ncbi:type III-A CRISPR-associated RAMP protein Csm5 [Emticicia sp. W12TSBA100-4]|uniref:type III-A CRISPR-associated RAMP protein Csm5 n=1 Tax=Emticicia sp. W12TSBA100-4 TaxID=3160965 RepID=UPI0033065C6D
MNKFLIETITPLHIGSGRTLQGNTEYLYFDKSKTVSIIDEHKVLKIIGDENIDRWVNIIEKGDNLLDYLIQRSPTKSISPSQTDKRLLKVKGNSNPAFGKSGIREQLFSGNGQPILPGSSLKGAVRTAILNQVILKSPSFANRINDFKEVYNGRVKYKGVQLEKKYFGGDPNHDVFRLLRICDTHFNQTECILAETLNEEGGVQKIKQSVQQHIECIPANQSALCSIQIPQDLIREIEKRPSELSLMKGINSIKSIPIIFAQIKAHSKKHIEQEIKKYELLNLPHQADSYVEILKDIYESYQNLSENQCILRVGFGTGYLSMTGGWAEEQWKKIPNNDYKKEMNDLATAVRKNDRYNGMALPKSRKIVLGGIPLGFLKLTLFTADEATQWEEKIKLQAIKDEAKRLKDEQEANEQAELKATEAAIAEAERIEKERFAAEEASKPEMFEGKIKKGDIIDAEVVKVEGGKTATLKFYAAGQETNTFRKINYNGIQVGQIIQVQVNNIAGNGAIVAVEFKKFK